MSKLNDLETEQRFPYGNMSRKMRDFCLHILTKCKDISDSDIKVDGNGKCEIVELHFHREKKYIYADGSLIIDGKNRSEVRCVEIYFSFDKDYITVDMNVERVSVKDEPKSYNVRDDFYLENDVLKRGTHYSYDLKGSCIDIDDNEMKGRLK